MSQHKISLKILLNGEVKKIAKEKVFKPSQTQEAIHTQYV